MHERRASPPLYKCNGCGCFGFNRTRGNGLRNGRIVPYQCSFPKCKRVAKIRSKYRGSRGLFAWACCRAHAVGSRFEETAVA